MTFRIFPLVLTVCLLDCAEKHTPPEPPGPIVRLHADLLVVREEARLRGLDTAALRHQTDSLARNYGVTPEWYETTLEGLRSNLAAWKAFNERVVQRLDTLRRESTPADTGRTKATARPR